MKDNSKKVVNLKPKKKKHIRVKRILFSFIFIYLICFFSYQGLRIISLKNQEKSQIDKLQELQKTKDNYQEQLEQVNDPQNIEKIAREKLRMIKPEETLYVDLTDSEEIDVDEENEEEE